MIFNLSWLYYTLIKFRITQQLIQMITIVIILLLVIGLFLWLKSVRKAKSETAKINEIKLSQKIIQKQKYGHLQILFGSQTGTAAKMAETFAEQAIQNGFQPEVIDLKNIKYQHFNRKGEISIFFLSNTGQGQTPENAIRFVKVLKQQQKLHQQKIINWSQFAFTVFGLGNTQYQFYNKTGVQTDKSLQKLGAKRVYQLGLGDSNASLQDDFNQWKLQLWPTIQQYRRQNPIQQRIIQKQEQIQNPKQQAQHQYISKVKPLVANFKLFICANPFDKLIFTQQQLDFKTKASLKFEQSKLLSIREVRQKTISGSTLQLEIQLQNSPQYQTAGNIALYPKNDPLIVQQVIQYFGLTNQQLQAMVSVQKLEVDKKLKLNFIPYSKLIDLLTSYVDLQGKLTKGVLKKLGKFQSNDQKYFIDNSSAKTTAEFKRITQQIKDMESWYYLIKLIKQKQVKLCLQDFIQLCDSIAPRLFTIASSYKVQKNVMIMASITPGGLISKFFSQKPQNIRAQLRKSTFVNVMKWQKVIFISAGTGLAPFRGLFQQKQLLMKQDNPLIKLPNITLYFGCKRPDQDYIYRNEIQHWVQSHVINQINLAFSRQSQQKIYVQHLLARNQTQVIQFLNNQTQAIYICGSVGMGHDVTEVIAKLAGGHQKIKELQQKGRIVKELW